MLYSIDRIIEGFTAVCEDETGSTVKISLSVLPDRVREGDVIREENGKFTVDAAETQRRKDEMFDLQSSIFKRKNK